MTNETLNVPRLIDANALKEAIRNIEFHFGDSFDDAIADAVDAIESAPTVETTKETEKDSVDSVLARLPKNFGSTFLMVYVNDDGDWECGYPCTRMGMGIGQTPLEAVTRLEAALRA